MYNAFLNQRKSQTINNNLFVPIRRNSRRLSHGATSLINSGSNRSLLGLSTPRLLVPADSHRNKDSFISTTQGPKESLGQTPRTPIINSIKISQNFNATEKLAYERSISCPKLAENINKARKNTLVVA